MITLSPELLSARDDLKNALEVRPYAASLIDFRARAVVALLSDETPLPDPNFTAAEEDALSALPSSEAWADAPSLVHPPRLPAAGREWERIEWPGIQELLGDPLFLIVLKDGTERFYNNSQRDDLFRRGAFMAYREAGAALYRPVPQPVPTVIEGDAHIFIDRECTSVVLHDRSLVPEHMQGVTFRVFLVPEGSKSRVVEEPVEIAGRLEVGS